MNKTANSGFYPWERSKNALLLKDDVGRGKPSAYNLPQQNFVYGKPLPRDNEGAREVTMTWKFHNETPDQQPQRDFRQLNKLSVNSGLYKSTQFSDFRKSTDARVKIKKGRNALPLYIPEEQFRYGRVNRPSTPIHLVVGNCYGTEHQMRQTDLYRYHAENDIYNKPRLLPRGNKATVLSYTHTKQKLTSLDRNRPQQNQFKLTKFKGVAPRTNTYNDPFAKSVGRTQDVESVKSQQQQKQQQQQNQNQGYEQNQQNVADQLVGRDQNSQQQYSDYDRQSQQSYQHQQY